jgi:Ribosomal protein L7/L12 C-terminal domain/Short C-terminal domain
MTIALEGVIVLLGVALLVGFLTSVWIRPRYGDDEKPKRFQSSSNVTSELERLFSLLQSGALTHDEYNQLKDRLLKGQSSPLNPDLDDAIRNLLLQRRKIEAVKLYKETTGLGLKEAKDAVEDIERSQRMGGL